MARCIPLLLQFSTCTNLPHLLSLNQSHASFNLFPLFHPQLALYTFSIHFMYHCLHQNIFLRSSQNITVPPHTICPCQLICCFFQAQHIHQLHSIPLVHQLYTTHCSHQRSSCSSQNSYFILSQTPCFTFI